MATRVISPPTPTTPPHERGNIDLAPKIHQIINRNLPPHLNYYRKNHFSQSFIPSSLPTLKQAISNHTSDPNRTIATQMESAHIGLSHEITRQAYQQSKDSGSIDWDQIVEKSVKNYKENNPLTDNSINKKTIQDLKRYLQGKKPNPRRDSKTAQRVIHDGISSFTYLDPETKTTEHFKLFRDDDEKNTFLKGLYQELRDQAASHPDKEAKQIIKTRLLKQLLNNPDQVKVGNNFTHLHDAIEQTSSNLSTTAQTFQNIHQQLDPKRLPRYTARDPLAALNLGVMPSNSGFISRYYHGRTYKNITSNAESILTSTGRKQVEDQLGEEFVNHLFNQYGPEFWTNKKAQQNAALAIYSGDVMSLIGRGVTVKDLDRKIEIAQSSWFHTSVSSNDPHLQRLIKLRNKLEFAEKILEHNPHLLSNFTRFQRGWGNFKNTVARNTPGHKSWLKFRRTGKEIGFFARHTTAKATHRLLAPMVAMHKFGESINPFIIIDRKITQPAKSFIKKKAKQAALKIAAKIGEKTIARKLIYKGVLAMAGIGTGGIGTAITILSIVKDLYHLVGGKEAIKKLLFIVAARIILLVGKVIAFLTNIGSLALSIGSYGLIGGAIFGPVGALAGGAYGALAHFIPTLGPKALLASLKSLAVTAANGVSAFFSNFMTALSGATQTAAVATATAMGVGVGGTMLVTAHQNELMTLRVNPETGGVFMDEGWHCENENNPPPSNAGAIISGSYAYPVVNRAGSNACYHWGGDWVIDIFSTYENEPQLNLPVLAYSNGTVWSVVTNDSLGGKYIILQGNDGRFYYYAHLCAIHVTQGENVGVGQVIGTTDRTGLNASVTPEHLHFGIQEGVSIPDFTGGGNVCPFTDIREKFGIVTCNDPANECVEGAINE